LGITCSQIFHIIRPFLYRNVVIEADGHQSNASHVLALLAHDKSLAKCVVQLTLKHIQPPGYVYDPQITPPSLINVDALTNMVSLQHVALYGPVFLNAHEQNEFGRVLAGIPLDELTYIADIGADIGDEEFPADRMGDMGGLKKLYWGGNPKCAFISLLTLSSLSHCRNSNRYRAAMARFVTFHINDPYSLSTIPLMFGR
jgi:hypothetical protein